MFRAIYDMRLSTRLLYFTFFQFGRMSLFANIMMAGDGTVQGKRFAEIGVCASCLMICSGILGMIHHPIWAPLKYAKWFGAAGVVGQVIAFLSTLV